MAVEAQDLTARLAGEFPGAMRGGQLVACFQPEFALPAGAPVTRPSVLPFLAVAASYLLLTIVGLKHISPGGCAEPAWAGHPS